MTLTIEEVTVSDEKIDELEQLAAQVPEDTRRGLAIASFADTGYAVTHEWGPAHHRQDYPGHEVDAQSLSSYSL